MVAGLAAPSAVSCPWKIAHLDYPLDRGQHSGGIQGDTFMKFLVPGCGVLVAGLLASGTPAFSSTIDLSTWTCAKFQAADKDDIGVILAWLDGYYRDENDPPVVDTEKFVANAKKLGQYCAKHPDIGLITAADELFSK
jgi:acid stress chaperone HdeB